VLKEQRLIKQEQSVLYGELESSLGDILRAKDLDLLKKQRKNWIGI
jgi:hypothetical protein